MMSLTFGLFTQVSGSGPLGPLVFFKYSISTIDVKKRKFILFPQDKLNHECTINCISIVSERLNSIYSAEMSTINFTVHFALSDHVSRSILR